MKLIIVIVIFLINVLYANEIEAKTILLDKTLESKDSYKYVLLGKKYYRGRGVSQDLKRGLNLFKQACELGNNIGCKFYNIYMMYELKIETTATDNKIYLMGIKPRYKEGMLLKKGVYRIKVKATGYYTKLININLVSNEVQFIKLKKIPYKLIIKTTPSNSTIDILGVRSRYKNGIMLDEGVYSVRVKAREYYTKVVDINLTQNSTTTIDLDIMPKLDITATPSNAKISIRNIVPKYKFGMRLTDKIYNIRVEAIGYETVNFDIDLIEDTSRIIHLIQDENRTVKKTIEETVENRIWQDYEISFDNLEYAN